MTAMKASEIRLVWCENHGGLLMGGLVHSATTSCVKVPMRLIPDNGETVWWCLVHRSIGTETRCDGWQLVSAFHEPQSPCRIVAAHLIHAGETVT